MIKLEMGRDNADALFDAALKEYARSKDAALYEALWFMYIALGLDYDEFDNFISSL